MNKQFYLVGLVCFCVGWVTAKFTQPAISDVESSISSTTEPMASHQTTFSPSTLATPRAIAVTASSGAGISECMSDDSHTINADELNEQKIRELLAQLNLEFSDADISQMLEQQSLFTTIEEQLLDSDAGANEKLRLVGHYFDGFYDEVSKEFAASLMLEYQYDDNDTQTQLLNMVEGFAYHAYENGNHRPLQSLVDNLYSYQQSREANIRLGALKVIHSAIDDTARLKQMVAPYLNDSSEQVQAYAKSIMAVLR